MKGKILYKQNKMAQINKIQDKHFKHFYLHGKQVIIYLHNKFLYKIARGGH